MSLFANHLFAGHTLGQVTLPEPASDELIAELATTGGRSRTVEPAPSTEEAAPKGGAKARASAGIPWVPITAVGGALLFAGLVIWAASRRPKPNRRRRHGRRRWPRTGAA